MPKIAPSVSAVRYVVPASHGGAASINLGVTRKNCRKRPVCTMGTRSLQPTSPISCCAMHDGCSKDIIAGKPDSSDR